MKRQNRIVKRRRRECKTNYTKRLSLLKGRYNRLVVRKSNRYIILQIVESKLAQDKVLYSVNTKDLLGLGWPEDKKGSLKSLSAAYLGGYLLGKKAKDLKSKIILDSGLIPSTKGSRVYAVVKGIAEAGIDINCSDEVIPEKEKIESKEFFNKVKEAIK